MTPEIRPAGILRFGVYEVEARAGELRKQGVRVKLQEQPFQVLVVLLRRAGEVVTREELRAELWKRDTFVDFDNGLNTCINKIREALGDSADNPRFVETLPRRGYRFIAPISGAGAAVGESAGWVILRKRIVAAVAVLVLATGIAGGLIWRARQVRKLTEKDTIVLGDFVNTTGDPLFDDTLKQGLRVHLEQSPFLNILSDENVNEQLRLMGRAKGERLTQDVTREVCQRAGSKAYLIGTVSSLGAHYVIGLNALNCSNGEGLGSEQVEADDRDNVLKVLGEAATKLRTKLGERLASVQKYDVPLVHATTPSLEALKAYSLGMKTWFAKGDRAALPLFQRAAELDPDFAMAHARVAMVHWNLEDDSLAAKNLRKAYELRAKISQWEQLYVEAHYYDHVTGELEKAAQVYEQWEQIYPRDWVPYNNLASLNAYFGNHEAALEKAVEALRLQPDNEDNYVVAIGTFLDLNRLDEATTLFKHAEERKLGSELLVLTHYRLAFLRGDEKEMGRLVESVGSKPGINFSFWLREIFAAGYRGRRNRAREIARQRRDSAVSDRHLTWLATAIVEAYFGNTEQARADVGEALKLNSRNVDAAQALSMAGDVRRAIVLVEEISKRNPSDTSLQRYWLPTIRAMVALDRHEPERAIEELSKASPYEMGILGHMHPVYVRGQAYLMQGNGSAAATEFQKILDHPGIVVYEPLGALAHLQLGRAYSMQGDSAKARAAYQDFLMLWKDADPDIPILQQAKAEYAKLQTR
jgi:eukaryotic-like serine/threonine-protein kinase